MVVCRVVSSSRDNILRDNIRSIYLSSALGQLHCTPVEHPIEIARMFMAAYLPEGRHYLPGASGRSTSCLADNSDQLRRGRDRTQPWPRGLRRQRARE